MRARAEELSRLEEALGRLLVTGVIVSSALLAIGLGLVLLRPEHVAGSWMLDAGLMTLMGTPILRVVVSVVEYVRLKDWFFVGATLLVLVELATTLTIAMLRR